MSEPSSEAALDAAAPGSAGSRLWGALVAPSETFHALAARPVWALALVFLLLVGLGFGFVAMGKITPEDFLQSIEAQGRPAPPAMQDDPEAFLATMRWVQIGAGTVFAGLFYLGAAGVFVVLFRLLGSDLTYRQSLATTVHGLLPLGVAALVGLIVVFGREQVSLAELQSGDLVMSNLGFLAGDEAGAATRALLGSLDLFSLWSAALLALGYQVVARVSKGAAWGVVGVLWAVAVGAKVALASIF